MIRWPLPYEHSHNQYEVVGRYLAQTILLERFIDMALLSQGADAARLLKARLSEKIKDVAALVTRPELDLNDWADLPSMMTKVARHRNQFAHRFFERSPTPSHYGQGLPYTVLADDELHEQEWQAFEASEVCRQLLERLIYGPLNPGVQFERTNPPRWASLGPSKPR